MELTFVRADHEVTGSCHYLHVGAHHILVDYGMEQGRNYFENIPLPVQPSVIDIVLITHAHIDHTGMLPELYAKGFRGRIVCTKATRELSDIMLRDSAHIQMQEAEYANQKAEKRGTKERVEPVYTMEDAMNTMLLFEAYPYGEMIELCDGVVCRFTDIGHLLGSASIELWLTEDGQTKKIVFSGDIGNTDQPLLRDPQPTRSADYVVMESTYGSRYHDRPNNDSPVSLSAAAGNTSAPDLAAPSAPSENAPSAASASSEGSIRSDAPAAPAESASAASAPAAPSAPTGNTPDPAHFPAEHAPYKIPLGANERRVLQLAAVLRDTMARGGNLVIPAFAVGRTQVMLYYIKLIKENNLVPDHPDFPVYVDSPMAVTATNIFENNEIDCYDEEARAMLDRGINPLSFPNLHLTITTEESQAINTDPEPKVIISASGMCDAGRIRHHLKYNVGNPKSTILFVGYQSEGTLGRRLMDGAEKVKIFGVEYEVRAKVAQMDGMSGHADKQGLLDWINAFEEKPRQVFIVHGDDEAASSFADCLTDEYGYHAMAPYSGTKYDLLAGRFICIAKPVPVRERVTSSSASAAGSYTKLKIAQKRLDAVIEAAAGLPNKDLEKFTRAINDLCSQYRVTK